MEEVKAKRYNNLISIKEIIVAIGISFFLFPSVSLTEVQLQPNNNSYQEDTEISHLKKLLETHRANLRKLEKDAAVCGLGEVPLKLQNQIEHEKGEIKRIEDQIPSKVTRPPNITTPASTIETSSMSPKTTSSTPSGKDTFSTTFVVKKPPVSKTTLPPVPEGLVGIGTPSIPTGSTSSDQGRVLLESLWKNLIAPIIVVVMGGIILIWYKRRMDKFKGSKAQTISPEKPVEQKPQTNQGKFIQVLKKDSFELSDHLSHEFIEEATLKLKDYLKTKGKTRMILAIMFTDLEGSTELTARFGDAWWDRTRDKINKIAIPIIEKTGFYVKNIGDSYMAGFESGSEAVKTACNLQIALSDFNKGHLDEPELKMRIGLHSGEVTLEKDDLFGTNVNIASRIEYLASGGQILMSEQVYRDANSYKKIEVKNIGPKKLKGIDEEITVYELLITNDQKTESL